MKKAFIITSIIEVDNQYPLTYSATRSFFNSEDRLAQTLISISCLNTVINEGDTIYILDASYQRSYNEQFKFQNNLKFIDVKEHFSDIHSEVTSHPHKSRCECLMLTAFMEKFKDELDSYDMIYKLSGRYFFESNLPLPESQDHIFFKTAICFQWSDSWGLDFLDRRLEQQDNTLRQYSTVFFGWAKKFNADMLNIFKSIANTVVQPEKSNSDMETLIYFFTRRLEPYIIETDWSICGWNGTNGKYLKY